MNKVKSVTKNISYTLSSNLLSLLVSMLITLFLPRVLGVESYGYYQLYLFYVSYVGFLHFGWCDGIYLRYGGDRYKELDYPLFRGQFYSLFFSQLIISIIFTTFILFSSGLDSDKIFILMCTMLNIIILNLRTFSVFVLQATNRMKDYSIIVISDRILYIIMVFSLLLFGIKTFYLYIICDVLAKLFSLFLSMVKTHDITKPIRPITWDMSEIFTNIKVGINLMLANVASILIIGIVRFGVQIGWDISTFGKVSLTLSISNMLMVFVNAVSLAIFPLLKRENKDNYVNIYNLTRTVLMPVIFIVLLSYYPLKLILGVWLPEYSESIRYMAIVFPMVVFEAKTSLLTNTYLKALRKEKLILRINILTVIFSVILTFIIINLIHNLTLAMFLIVFLLALRSTLSELVLAKFLDVSIIRQLILEILLVLLFIYANWNFSISVSFILYTISLVVYLYLNKSDIIMIKNKLKALGK